MSWTLMLLFLCGALCSEWMVEYQQQLVCALSGSTIVLNCSFFYPRAVRVTRVMWSYESNIFEGPFIYDSEVDNTFRKFQYIGDKQQNCSVKIHKVEPGDAGIYTFRFITNKKEGKWSGKPGLTLRVADLHVSGTKPHESRATKEGDSLNLTCISSCDAGLLSSAFTWFKNGEPINEGSALYLSNVSSTNSGNYSCSLKTHMGTTSRVVNIDVEYGPKNTSASVRPSMEVDAGSNVTLICSSRANPPVENYTWFKIDEDEYILDVWHQPVFISADGGRYFCCATNKHGSQNSTFVTVKIKENWMTFIRDLLIVLTVALLVVLATVFAIMRLMKKETRGQDEPDFEEDTQNTDYVNWPSFVTNRSHEGSQCEGATADVIYATVDFHTKKTSHMEQQTDSHHDEECVIYSTVCRSQLMHVTYRDPLT